MDIDTLDRTAVAVLSAETSIEISDDKERWLHAAFDLARDTNNMNWRWCDWYLSGEAKGYGTLKALCGMPNWPGPHYRRFQNMLSVCRKVGSRRREDVSFELHTLVAPCAPEQQEELLNWIERENALGNAVTKTVLNAKVTEFRLQHQEDVTVNCGKKLRRLIRKLSWNPKDIDELNLLLAEHKRDIDPQTRAEAYKALKGVRDLSSSFAEDFRDRRDTQES